MTDRRVLILGLDGATWRLLRPLVQSGHLPNLAALIDAGAHGSLLSAVPPLTAPAWTDFQTGANAGKHGVFDFRIFDRGARRLWLVNSQDIRLPTLWQIASAAGRRVIAVNVPLTYPPQPVNGIVIGGMLAQKEDASLMYPPERFNEVFARHPDYRISPPIISQRKQLGRSAFVDANIAVEKARAGLALDLMKREPWDLFMVQNQCLDYIQHAYFHLMDPDAAEFDKAGYTDVLRFYQAMDSNIGRLVDAVPANTDVVVVSDHGFKLQHRLVHLAPWLRAGGYLVEKISPRQRALQLARRLDVFRLRRRLAHRILPNKQSRFGAAATGALDRIDWDHTRAFVAIGSVFGCVFINHARVPDPESLLAELTGKLQSMTDERDGRKVVDQVLLGSQVYQGPYASFGPDLIAVPADDYTFGAPSLIAHQTPFVDIDFGLEIPGGHHPEGILVWTGEGLHPRSDVKAKLRDIAPTILARLGVPVPDHMDGQPLQEIFTTPLDVEWNVWDFNSTGKQASGGLDRDDEVLQQRLKDLGYL